MTDNVLLLTDYQGRQIRLTPERLDHILEHPEMTDQLDRLRETIVSPTLIMTTLVDTTVHVYHRFYEKTPVTRKYLQVAVKLSDSDTSESGVNGFVLTAFYSNRQKKGIVIWQV